MWCKTICQSVILPCRQQISNNPTSEFESFIKEASDSCASDGEREKAKDNPIGGAHRAKLEQRLARTG
jgi:hypothetical protein